jgi:hypothetical protein
MKKPVNAATPFFDLGVIVNNGGRTSTDSLTINLTRILPGDDPAQFELPPMRIPAVRYQDTVYFRISNQELNSQGFDLVGGQPVQSCP